MSYTLYLGFLGIFLFMLVFNSIAVAVAQSAQFATYRIRKPGYDVLNEPRKYFRIGSNGVLVFVMYATFMYVASNYLIVKHSGTLNELVLQSVSILLIYDFMYYWVHRMLHTPFLMKHVHGTHHKVRFTTAMDGLYLNPIDNIVGTGLFFVSVVLVAPISVSTLLVSLFLYLFINNVNHTGLNFNHPLFWITNFLARKHDHHHGGNLRSNFGSIVPFWDILFGTYE